MTSEDRMAATLRAFQDWDTDRTGTIPKEQLRHLFQRLGLDDESSRPLLETLAADCQVATGSAEIDYTRLITLLFLPATEPTSLQTPLSGGRDRSGTAVEAQAKEAYDKIVAQRGGQEALEQCAHITDQARSKLSAQSALLHQEREQLWALCPPNVASRLREIADELECTFARQDPIFGCMPYKQMMKAAAPIKTEFDRILDRVQQRLSDLGVQPLLKTGLKGPERGEKKVAVDYAGDGSKLTDMVRGTFEIQGTLADLYKVLHELATMPELSSSAVGLEEVKDRYLKPLKGGYRDISLLLRVSGMVCELQLNLKEVLEVKESPIGHGLYEQTRLVTDNLLFAAMNGNVEQMMIALKAGADPDVRDGRFH